jgi:hypothetical protein
VKLNAVPAVAEAGAETVRWVAGALETTIEFEVPVIDEVTVSVAEIVRLPAVLSVAENVPTPFVKVESAGRTGDPSVLVK